MTRKAGQFRPASTTKRSNDLPTVEDTMGERPGVVRVTGVAPGVASKPPTRLGISLCSADADDIDQTVAVRLVSWAVRECRGARPRTDLATEQHMDREAASSTYRGLGVDRIRVPRSGPGPSAAPIQSKPRACSHEM